MNIAVVRDEIFLAHKTGHTHPEKPARLKAIYRLLDREFSEGLIRIKPQPATLEQLELVHTPVYIQKVLRTADQNFTSLATQTPVSAQTYLAAWLAAGSCIAGIDALLTGTCEACLCLVRPPGHHALADRAAGFCVFNNLAVAARYAIESHGIQRVLIIDWDVHHGNGIQDIFYRENAVFYFSTHDPNLFPFSGKWTETGMDHGLGYTLNIPMPREINDNDVAHVYWHVLSPLIRAYRPQLILISAGFDAHRRDTIGRWRLSAAVFGRLTELLRDLRASNHRPPILFSLEGGYEPLSLAECLRKVLLALTTHPRPAVSTPVRTPLGIRLIEKAREIHRPYDVWT